MLARLPLVAVLLATVACGSIEDSRIETVRSLNDAVLSMPMFNKSLLAERAEQLSRLVAEDPAAALELALPEKELRRLARQFPDAARHLEARATLRGPARYLVLDSFAGQALADVSVMVDERRVQVHFVRGGRPAGLRNGVELEVTGLVTADGGSMAALGGSLGQSGLASAWGLCSFTGPQRTVVILATFPGVTPQNTVSGLRDIFFDGAGPSLDGYWREVSGGVASATGDVLGPFTLPDRSYDCTQFGQLIDDAVAAADAAVDFSRYQRLFVVTPDRSTCHFGGVADVGCTGYTTPTDGGFIASRSWLNDGSIVSRESGVHIGAHEGGHLLGLSHSASSDYGADAVGPLGSGWGTTNEYGDPFAAMGGQGWQMGHYAAPHKELLGWLPEGSTAATEGPGSFTLAPYETPSGGLQVLKVRRWPGASEWLWLEYRQPVGYDAILPAGGFVGPLAHWQGADPMSLYTALVDFTPTSAFTDAALAIGGTWNDRHSGLSLSVGDAGAAGVTVDVSYGPPACALAAAPTVTLSPASLAVAGGGTASLTATVTSHDDPSCPAGVFTLATRMPAHWRASWSTTALTLAPGATATATVSIAVKQATDPGDQAVTVTAARSGPTAEATSTLQVSSSCQLAAPTVELIPEAVSTPADDVAALGLRVTSRNSAGCGTVDHGIYLDLPAGWRSAIAGASPSWLVRLGAGGAALVFPEIYVPAGAPLGVHTVRASSVVNQVEQNGGPLPEGSDPDLTGSATASLTVGASACARSAPTVVLSPPSLSASAGGWAGPFTMTVTNTNPSSCPPEYFRTSWTGPGGWTYSPLGHRLLLASGQSDFASFHASTPAGAVPGAYPIYAAAAGRGPGSTSAIATVNLLGPCVRADPTVTLSPSTASVAAGASRGYTLGVVNNDSAACAAATFNLTSTLPAGWGSSIAPASLTLAPGASGTATLTKTPPVSTPPASYTVEAGAASATGSASASATCTVLPALAVTVSVPGTSFPRNSRVPLTADSTSGGAPAAGAAVTFKLVLPNGAITTLSATANGSGRAVKSYTVTKKGSHQLSATLTYGGQTAQSNVVTFTVH